MPSSASDDIAIALAENRKQPIQKPAIAIDEAIATIPVKR